MANSRAYYESLARKAAVANGIDPDLFARQINAESGFNPSARSGVGAQGIAQIMPATARGWGVNPNDPQAALNAAARAMSKYVKSYGGYRNALVAYNAGPGRVGKPLYAETRNYINRIMGGQSEPSVQYAPTTPAMQQDNSGVLAFIFKGSPLAGLMSTMQAGQASATQPTTRAMNAPNVPSGQKNYKWLQQVGQSVFKLKNDPGTSQTTGGKHTANSRHYAGMAVDFGTARNSRDKLNDWYQWAQQNKNKYGFKEVLDEGDHIHVAF
jgi:hypothetical protein